MSALERLVAEAPVELRGFCEGARDSARRHHDIIARFGRFPHRNHVLGRESTEAEQEWLAAGGESFGQ